MLWVPMCTTGGCCPTEELVLVALVWYGPSVPIGSVFWGGRALLVACGRKLLTWILQEDGAKCHICCSDWQGAGIRARSKLCWR